MFNAVKHSPNLARLSCFVLCFAGFLLSWSIWFPGFMSPDSYRQWNQVLSGNYADDHPTIMVLVWRALHIFHEGSAGLLFLHLSVFWLSLLSLSLRLIPRLGILSLTVPLIGLAPPVFGNLGAIWKDISLGISLLAALALAQSLFYRFSWKSFSLAFLLLVYAQNVRHNAPSAVLPFWIALALLALKHLKKEVSLRRTGMLSLAMLALASLSYKTFEVILLKPERSFFAQNLMLHDLAALSAHKQELLIPEPHRDPGCTLQSLSATYYGDTRCYDPFFYGKNPLQRIPSKEATDSLARLWIKEIASSPLAYLTHRWTFFATTLGWNQGPCRAHSVIYLYDSKAPSTRTIDMRSSAQKTFFWLENYTLLFTPWVYLAAAMVLFIAGLRSKPSIARNILLLSSSSGILYFLPYFFVSVCCDFRYSWWTALSSLLAGIFYFSGFSKTGARTP